MNVIRREHQHPLHWRITVDRDGVLIERGRWVGFGMLALALVMLSGCAYSRAEFQCSATSGGSVTTLRLGTAIEASGPVCQAGTATVSSDPSQGVGALTKSLGIIEKLVAPGVGP